jgi:HEXXH motif-containing protein
MSVRVSDNELRMNIGGNAAKFMTESDLPELSPGLEFEPSLRVETSAGKVLLPIDVSGLADSYHSNAPIVRSMRANREWIEVLKDAIDLLHSQSASTALNCVRLSPAALALHCGGTAFGSSSPQEVMGLVFLPGVTDRYDVAECFLHESLHQKLYRVEEGASLFEGEAADDEIFYSPWRSDPRPLRMLMHGAYVFAGVSNFWKQNYLNSSDQESRRNAGFHCYYRAKQAQIAMDIVSKYSCRTAVGIKVSEVIESGIDDAMADLRVEPFAVEDAETRLKSHREMFSKYTQ